VICVAPHTKFTDRRLGCSRMRSFSLLLGALAWLAASSAVSAQQPAPTREELERSGATIRAIYVTVDNVFDPNNPDEDKKLYRWANNVHVLTRESVVLDILVIAPGDRFIARRLDESARALRAGGFIAEATVEIGAYVSRSSGVAQLRFGSGWV